MLRQCSGPAFYRFVLEPIFSSPDAPAPLSFKTASYSGIFTLSGEGRLHHGGILRDATKLAERGKIKPQLDSPRFNLGSVGEAYALMECRQAAGKLVIDIAG
jgi:NADPH2:quinone reductase